MPRVAVDFRTSSLEAYKNFCKENRHIKIDFKTWSSIIYTFNENIRNTILETGERFRMLGGLGDFSINKKIRKKVITYKGVDYINLPIDWKKTKEKGKKVYNFNYHTEGYSFKWIWFKTTTKFKNSDLWSFKPSRVASRLLANYLTTKDKYKDIYMEYIK